MDSLLTVNNIEVIYNHVILVLKGISLEIPQGSIYALLGSNGAGKSTTLKAISGLLKPERGEVTDGSIEFMGERIDKKSAEEIVPMGIVQVMEGRHVFEDLTTLENLKSAAYTSRKNKKEIKENIELVFSYFPVLKPRSSWLAGYLSGGEQQMLAIGRALMCHEVKLLLLDEPSLGLAPILVKTIFEIIKKINLQSNISILLVEQNARLALSVAEYAYIMENGKIVMDDESDKLSQNQDIQEFYLGMTEAGKASYRAVKHYKRRKRWLSS